MYDSVGSYRLPMHPDLLPTRFTQIIKPEAVTKLRDLDLRPLFLTQQTKDLYALSATDTVHFVNPHLFNYILRIDPPEIDKRELSYTVAPNIDRFSVLYDRELIPKNFYLYYRKPFKIINYSNFDINNVRRKVFIEPYVFELDAFGTEPFMRQNSDGRRVLYMDKIRKGETLQGALQRIVKTELKIADDFIGAIVHPRVSFDLDRDGIVTPRLIVSVFVQEIRNKEWFDQVKKTGWVSLDQSIPRLRNVKRES